jgi:hypothetical protein
MKKLRENLLEAYEGFNYDLAVHIYNIVNENDPTTVESMKEDMEFMMERIFKEAKNLAKPTNKSQFAVDFRKGSDYGICEDNFYIRVWITGEVDLMYRPVFYEVGM